MARTATTLRVTTRTPSGSRAARRLRREGRIPGVLYGGGEDPLSFEVDARDLRLALAATGAVLEVSVDGSKGGPAVLKDAQRHVVRGNTLHVDLLRVRLDRPIHAVVTLELTGAEDAPGVREGGVLEQVTRELNIEALPNDIPESIVHDVSALEMNDTLTLAAISAPQGVTMLDDPDETLVATVTPPRLQTEDEDEIEAETEVVGEGEGAEAAEAAAGAEGAEAPAEGESGE